MDEWFGTAASSLAWALIDFLWRGLLVGWVAALLLALMRKARPQARYLVACGALLLCAALPLAGMVARMAEADAGAASSALPVVAGSAVAGAVSALPLSAIDAGKFAGWESVLQERLPLVLLLWPGCAAVASRGTTGSTPPGRRGSTGWRGAWASPAASPWDWSTTWRVR